MSFLKKFLDSGEILETLNSPINGKIDVFRSLSGRISLRCGGVVQSGGLVEELWQKGVKEISKFRQNKGKINKCLILGLGGGTLVKLLSKEFPGCEITGVEIDSFILQAGKKYFGLKEIRDLEIIVDDAFAVLSSPKYNIHNSKYDLIVVDLYKGQEFPLDAEKEIFFKELLNTLNKDGIIVFNRLNYSFRHREKTAAFKEKVERSFKRSKTASVVTNLLLLASN